MSDTPIEPGGAGRPAYVLGDSERELARLVRQAEFFGEMTRETLRMAGIRPGMRVLDVGCGAGDVSFIARDIVGADGKVLGIDTSPRAVDIARARAEAAGRSGVEFMSASIDEFDDYAEYDAVTGRFILMHLPDPAAVVAGIARRVRPGTILTFGEFDLDTASAGKDMKLFWQNVGRIIEVYKRAGFEPNMGSRLYATFRRAGLEPELFGFTRVGGRNDVAGFDFLAESVRSLMPAMEKTGIAATAEIDIDSLRDRLVTEAARADACIFYPRFIGVWARTPGGSASRGEARHLGVA